MANGDKTPVPDDTIAAAPAKTTTTNQPRQARAAAAAVDDDRERRTDERATHAAMVEGVGTDPDASILNRDDNIRSLVDGDSRDDSLHLPEAHATPQSFMPTGFGHVGPEPLEGQQTDDTSDTAAEVDRG